MKPSASGSPRLYPVAENIYHDGAPFVPLSPHKSLRNACVLYSAIKDLPDKILVRGDFNKKSVPFIYFPDRPKRKIIGASQLQNGIAAKNIETGRKELASFVDSIVDSARCLGKSDHQITQAKMNLNLMVFKVEEEERDFTVGDIKEPLKKLAHAYALENVRKLTSPHRLLPRQGSSIQDKRLREFVHMARDMFGDLAEALRPKSPYRNNKYDTTPVIATYEIKRLFNDYLLQKQSGKINFSGYLRKNGISPYVVYFAKRWLEISLPKPTAERMQFSTEPWAKELDRICPLIIKEQRRTSRLMPPVSNNDSNESSSEVQLLYRQPSQLNLPPLPSIIDGSSSFSEDIPFNQQGNSELSSFSAYSPFKMSSKTELNKIDDNNKQLQPKSSALSLDTPDDVRAFRSLYDAIKNLPRFDLHIPYSSIYLGQPSEASSGAEADQPPATEQLTEQVADSVLEPFSYTGESFSDFSSQTSEKDSVTQALEKFIAEPSDSLRSSDTTSSSNLSSAGSRLFFSPERSSDSPFTSPQKIDEVSDTSSTEEVVNSVIAHTG